MLLERKCKPLLFFFFSCSQGSLMIQRKFVFASAAIADAVSGITPTRGGTCLKYPRFESVQMYRKHRRDKKCNTRSCSSAARVGSQHLSSPSSSHRSRQSGHAVFRLPRQKLRSRLENALCAPTTDIEGHKTECIRGVHSAKTRKGQPTPATDTPRHSESGFRKCAVT